MILLLAIFVWICFLRQEKQKQKQRGQYQTKNHLPSKWNKTYRSTHRKITFFSAFTDIFGRDVRHHGFPLLNALNIRLTSSLANMEEQMEYSPGLKSLALFKMSFSRVCVLLGKGVIPSRVCQGLDSRFHYGWSPKR